MLKTQSINIQRNFIVSTFLFILLTLYSAASLAAVKAGIIISSSGKVTALANGKERTLSRKSAFYQGDTIETAKDAKAKLKFTDGSTINLKGNSALEIKDYAFNGNKSKPEGKFDAFLKSGGLRAASGLIPDKDYKLQTPVAIIGIRGTSYEVIKNGDGTYTVQVYVGTIAVTITNKNVPTVLMSAKNAQARPDLIIIGERGEKYTIPPKDRVSTGNGSQGTSESSDTQNTQQNTKPEPVVMKIEDKSTSAQFTKAFTGGDSNNGDNETNITTGNQAATNTNTQSRH